MAGLDKFYHSCGVMSEYSGEYS